MLVSVSVSATENEDQWVPVALYTIGTTAKLNFVPTGPCTYHSDQHRAQTERKEAPLTEASHPSHSSRTASWKVRSLADSPAPQPPSGSEKLGMTSCGGAGWVATGTAG